MHEHVSVDWPFTLGLAEKPLETRGVVDLICERLEAAAEAGVSTFVDVGTESLGPTPLMLLCVASRSRVHIVSSIGCFLADMSPLPGWVYPPATEEEIADRFIALATDGPQGSGVKPGIIKVATSGRAITEVEERVLRAAAIAQQTTGLAITTHTEKTLLAEEQIEILADAGADLSRVVIGHMGWGSGVDDFELHKRLADLGVTIGLDMVGLPARTDKEYAQMAFDLIEAGYASQIVFSHDNVGYSRGLMRVYGEEWLTGDFTVVQKRLLPLLAQAGVDEETLSSIIVENPRRILAIDPERYPGAVDTLLKPLELEM